MDIFEQIKLEIVNRNILALDEMNHWADPGFDGLNLFLSNEGSLTPEQIAEVFAGVSRYPLYDKEKTPEDAEGDFFIEDGILWITNPWSSRLSEIIVEQATIGVDTEEIGIFVFDENMGGDAQSNTWMSAPDDVIEKAKAIILQANDMGSSDVHISPRTDEIVSVRFRVSGKIQPIFDLPLDDDYKALANTFLQMAGKHAGIYNAPVDAKFIIQHKKLKINCRLAMMPVLIMGSTYPRFVFRLAGNATTKALRSLNFLPRQITLLEDAAKRSDGLILNTGPMGSGKTTTLYAMLSLIRNIRKGVSIQTLEDPVEVNIANIDQTEINVQAGMTYATGLKTMLRSDANVILVGEIRDEETANLAVEAAMTGHLVLSTLHSRTAMGAIARLVKVGVGPSDLADTLALSAGQRMIRKVCQKCSSDYRFGNLKETDSLSYRKYAEMMDDDEAIIKTEGTGCEECGQTGYNGRTLLAEVALVDEGLQDLIVQGATMGNLNKYQKTVGFQDLWAHAIELVKRKETTLEEAESILPAISLGYDVV
jgi:type II secretory ATPase GspE/PulE/Tfp pilus assembly ATPase PilB-like protein